MFSTLPSVCSVFTDHSWPLACTCSGTAGWGRWALTATASRPVELAPPWAAIRAFFLFDTFLTPRSLCVSYVVVCLGS